MDKMPHNPDYVIVGVDTHASHVAVALSLLGEALGGRAFPATRAGYARLIEWNFGVIDRIDIVARSPVRQDEFSPDGHSSALGP